MNGFLVILLIILILNLMDRMLPGHRIRGGVCPLPTGPRPNIAPPAQGPRPEQILHVYHHKVEQR